MKSNDFINLAISRSRKEENFTLLVSFSPLAINLHSCGSENYLETSSEDQGSRRRAIAVEACAWGELNVEFVVTQIVANWGSYAVGKDQTGSTVGSRVMGNPENRHSRL